MAYDIVESAIGQRQQRCLIVASMTDVVNERISGDDTSQTTTTPLSVVSPSTVDTRPSLQLMALT